MVDLLTALLGVFMVITGGTLIVAIVALWIFALAVHLNRDLSRDDDKGRR
jgi:hypothetical protein